MPTMEIPDDFKKFEKPKIKVFDSISKKWMCLEDLNLTKYIYLGEEELHINSPDNAKMIMYTNKVDCERFKIGGDNFIKDILLDKNHAEQFRRHTCKWEPKKIEEQTSLIVSEDKLNDKLEAYKLKNWTIKHMITVGNTTTLHHHHTETTSNIAIVFKKDVEWMVKD